VLDYLEGFRFSPLDLEYLHSLGRFSRDFLEYLRQLRFTGSVRALPEGIIFFINEPVVEVTGPVIEAQLVETFLVNQTALSPKKLRSGHQFQQAVDEGAGFPR